MDLDEILLCHYCGKIFYKLTSFETHTRWKHMEKSNDFMCEQCGKTFHKKFNLIKHLASAVHKISESVKCALCDFKTLTRKVMCEHYKNFHKIVLNERNAYFKTSEDFFSWKIQYENKTRSRFVKMSSSRKRKNGFLRSTYFCHRDGNFIPKGKNLRHLKIKGSNKINAHCPAKIEVEIGESVIIVSYIDTHLGHDLDITRMNLDPIERAEIAEKLALKVPFEQILDEINSKNHDSDVTRINLLTRKDLWNIVETFKINPKSVVYSKTRMRRKKTLDQSKIEPPKTKVYLKVYDECDSKIQNKNHLASATVKEEELTDEQVIEMNDINDDSHFLYPIILKDENNEDVHQYVVISKETLADDGACLIINSKGEVESISRHQVVFSGDEGLQICQDDEIQKPESDGVQPCEDDDFQNSNDECEQICENIDEGDEVQIYDGGEVQIIDDNGVQIFDSNDIQIFENDGVQILQNGNIQLCEDESFRICSGEAIEIYEVDEQTSLDSANRAYETLETNKINFDLQYFDSDYGKCEHSDTNKSGIRPKANKDIKWKGPKIVLPKKVKNNLKPTSPKKSKITLGKQEYQLIYNDTQSNNEDVLNDIDQINVKQEEDLEMLNLGSTNVDNTSSINTFEEMSVEQVLGCEVTINNFDGNETSDYLIITDCKEDIDYSNSISNQEDVLTISAVQQDESLTANPLNEDVSNNIVKLEAPDYCLADEECFVVEDCFEVKEEGHQWHKKREDILNKVLNMHNMINNEQQLKIFSNNMISLENVLKSMSKSDDVINNLCIQKTEEIEHSSCSR